MKRNHCIQLLCVLGMAVTVMAAESENLLTNGGFESGVFGWSLGVTETDGASASRVIDSTTGTAKEGRCFHRITVDSVSSDNWHVQLKDPTWQADTNTIYHFSMWARADSARPAQISVYGGPDSKDTYRTSSQISLTTEWKQYHQMFPSDVSGMGRLNFAFVVGFEKGVYDLDDVVIMAKENNDGTLFPNGDFEADGAGWGLYVNDAADATGAATMSFPETGAQSGTKFCRIEVTSLPAQNGDIQLQDGVWTAEVGYDYRYSFWAKSASGGGSVHVAVQAGSSRNWAYLEGKSYILTDAWKKYEYVYSVDSIAGKDSINFNIYCGDALGVYDFDNMSLSKEGVAVRRPVSSVSAQESRYCTFSLLSDRVRVTPLTGASIDKVAVYSIQGRILYSTMLSSGAGCSWEMALSGGTWIVGVTSGHHEQRQKIVVP